MAQASQCFTEFQHSDGWGTLRPQKKPVVSSVDSSHETHAQCIKSRESSFDTIYSIFVLMNASVPALDDDEGMSEVCSKYMIYVYIDICQETDALARR